MLLMLPRDVDATPGAHHVRAPVQPAPQPRADQAAGGSPRRRLEDDRRRRRKENRPGEHANALLHLGVRTTRAWRGVNWKTVSTYKPKIVGWWKMRKTECDINKSS
eukprot:622494-Prorocentrum_minimum.AAC.2